MIRWISQKLPISRGIFQVLVLVFLTHTAIVSNGNTPSYSRLDAVAENLAKLEKNIEGMGIERRLVTLEGISKSTDSRLTEVILWQDKFQWALIALLIESLWRLYDQFNRKNRERSISHSDNRGEN